jgi:hypothetical protein
LLCYRFWEIKKNVLKTGTAPYTTAPYSRRPSRQYLEGKVWLEQYARQFGDRMPDRQELRLPSCITKQTVFEMYKTFSEQTGDPSLSRSSFYELWEKEFPDVKVTKVWTEILKSHEYIILLFLAII